MIETVLFDFDGTLMDTNELIIQSWQTTFRELRGWEADRQLLLDSFGEPLEGTMKKFFPDVPLEKSLPIYRGYQRANYLPNIQLFPGIRDLLDQLRKRQIIMGLVTSRLRFTTDQALEAFGLSDYFACVVTADDVTAHKPDPQCIQAALQGLQADPTRTLMVGDSKFDILCARNAGVRSALVSWTVTMEDQLRQGLPPELTPDAIIDRPQQILDLVRR